MGRKDVKKMSRGQAQTRSQSGKRILERCREKDGAKNMTSFDVDNGKFNDVIIIDIPESSQKKIQGSSVFLERKKYPSNNVISIDDDESSDDEKIGAGDGGLDHDSDGNSSKASCPVSNQSYNAEESDCDECQFIQETNFPRKLPNCKRTYSEKAFSINRSRSSSSDSDSSDCELMEGSSGKIREQWERASVRKKIFQDIRNGHLGFDGQASTSGCSSGTAKNFEADNLSKQDVEESFCTISSTDNDEKQNLFTSFDTEDGISTDPYFKHVGDGPSEDLHKHVGQDSSGHRTQLQEELQPPYRNVDMENTDKTFPGRCSFFENELPNERSLSHEESILRGKEKTVRETFLMSCRQSIHVQASSGKNCFQDKEANVCTESFCLKTQSGQGRQLNEDKYTFHEDGTSMHERRSENSDETSVKHIPRDDEKGNLGEESFSTESWNATNLESTSFNYKETPDLGDLLFHKSQVSDMTKIDNGTDEPVSGKSTQVQNEKEIMHEEVYFHDREKPLPVEPHCLNTQRDEIHLTNRTCSKTVDGLSLSQDECIGLSNAGKGDEEHSIQNLIIGEREKFKQTEEYKQAAEEEWASRQRQLQIQAEEAQRMRKRRKAETLRLLDMERRQKQRLEEIRETQKKNAETINLKEHLRSEVRKELDKLEVMHNDMASLLRGLGVHVGGGLCPTSQEVNAAYKQALLRFHPDRASRTDIHQQVEAEEKFKLISRLKEKLLATS